MRRARLTLPSASNCRMRLELMRWSRRRTSGTSSAVKPNSRLTFLKSSMFPSRPRPNAEIARPTVLTLGVFDGLHLGHQLIISRVVERARAVGAVPTVITFDPHPRAVLHPESAPPLLQTFDQKIEAFGVLGVEQAIVI